MKTLISRSFLAALSCGLFAATLSSAAPFEARDGDAAARLLARKGLVTVDAVGPYVARGTFRIQVVTKLGRPDNVLGDDLWLYEDRAIDGSNAHGTLVVRFKDGRVSELALATQRTVVALQKDPARTLTNEPRFAAK